MKSIAAICVFLALPMIARADVVELVAGGKAEGRVVARDKESITLEIVVGGRTFTRRWTLDKIHAVTIGPNREVLRPKAAGASPAPLVGRARSRAEVKAYVEKVGREPPEWWETVKPNYPRTLDLNWTSPPRGVWDNKRYIGQYVWDIINPNPGKWREGIRLMHELLVRHEKSPSLRARAMNELGRMYFDYYHDYGRAAFWWQSAAEESPESFGHGVALAECYWRLGSKEMAAEMLGNLRPQFSMIKLWAEIGDLPQALALAEANARGEYADIACIYAGDACRVAGQHQKALQYYQAVLRLPAAGRAQHRVVRNQQRAQASIDAIRLFDTLDLKRIPDGTYRAGSLGFETQVVVEVVVRDHRIESVGVVEHHEKQYFTAMTDTPRQIIEKQSVEGIDATSGATITSQAIIHATAKALAGAMKNP